MLRAEVFFPLALVLSVAIQCRRPLNNPYGRLEDRPVHYMAMADDPKTLDPVRANDTISFSILSNLVSTAYEYDYLARPIRLRPLLARDLPEEGETVFAGRPVHYFRFHLRPGLRYRDDSCFGGNPREVRAEDLIFNIKRTADRSLNPYAYPLLERIVGFKEYADAMEKVPRGADRFAKEIPGVRLWGRDGLEILLTQPDLQLVYFFAMASSAPYPEDCYRRWMADSRSTDRDVPASGAFYLKEWKPQARIVLERNPGFAGFQRYSLDGHTEEELPLLDEIRITQVRSGPTFWRMFRQGYLDRMSVGQDTFDQVFDGQELSQRFREKGIRADRENELATHGWAFNLADPLVGHNLWLRRAVACSIDVKELIDRFYRNRAIRARGLIPPGMEGGPLNDNHENQENHSPAAPGFSEPEEAYGCAGGVRSLLAKAGYPGGKDPHTGQPLELRLLDVARSGGTGIYRFYAESARKNGWELKIDLFDAPTYFEKRIRKEFQIVSWGWGADYPDPQNFFQLFYGPNRNTTLNEASYVNSRFDALYERILHMRPSRERERLLLDMDALLKGDVPIVLFHHPVLYSISWPWLDRVVPHPVDFNQLKFRRVRPRERARAVVDLNPLFGEGF